MEALQRELDELVEALHAEEDEYDDVFEGDEHVPPNEAPTANPTQQTSRRVLTEAYSCPSRRSTAAPVEPALATGNDDKSVAGMFRRSATGVATKRTSTSRDHDTMRSACRRTECHLNERSMLPTLLLHRDRCDSQRKCV